MATDMFSLPTVPPSGGPGPQFNPLEKLVETYTCILCRIKGFLGGPLLLDMDGSVQNKTNPTHSDAQIYSQLLVILLETEACLEEKAEAFSSFYSFSIPSLDCAVLLLFWSLWLVCSWFHFQRVQLLLANDQALHNQV